MMALYILPSLPWISACQLLAITSLPIILNFLFLIICRLQKQMTQLERIVYKQTACEVLSYREFGLWVIYLVTQASSLLILWF